MRPWLARALSHPALPAVAALLAVLLAAPSLTSGACSEDRVFRSLAQTLLRFPATIDLWGADAGHDLAAQRLQVATLKELGLLPWFTDADFKVALWRPLASLTHHLDYRLLAGAPWAWHAQNLAWAAAAALTAHAAFTALLGARARWVAGLAALLYAVDDAHGHAVGWVSNRNALMAAAFGALALTCHLAARRRPAAHAGTALALTAALFSSESALGALPYLGAATLFLDARPARARALALVPAALVTLGWFALYRLTGHGVWRSGLYLDPGAEPLAFVREGATRVLALTGGVVAGPPSDFWTGAPGWTPWLAALAVAVVGAFAAWVRPLWRAHPEARCLALGALGSLLPLLAVFPQDRVLWFPGLGVMGLVALGVEHAQAGAHRVGALALLGVHGLVAPALHPYRALSMERYEARLAAARAAAYAGVTAHDQVFLVGPPDHFFATMVAFTQVAGAAPGEGATDELAGPRPAAPGRTLALASGFGAVRLFRADPNTLELTPAAGLQPETFDRIYRPASAPLAVGDAFLGAGAEVRVLAAGGGAERAEGSPPTGAPATLRLRLARRLEDPRYRFLAWDGAGFQRLALPAVGAEATLPARPRLPPW